MLCVLVCRFIGEGRRIWRQAMEGLYRMSCSSDYAGDGLDALLFLATVLLHR